MKNKGYYWVDNFGWEVAYWDGSYWWLTGNSDYHVDGDFSSIGDRVIR